MAEANEKHREKGILETIREVNEKERAQKKIDETERIKKESRKKDLENEEYSRQLRNEKIELMKIKQGLAEDIVVEETAVNYTLRQKISAFVYCNKVILIWAFVFVCIAVFLVVDLIRKDRPDFTVMMMANDYQFDMLTDNFEEIINEYIEDYNDNGETHSTGYYMPLSDDLPAPTLEASSTKLFAFMQDGETMLVLADAEADKRYLPEMVLENIEELYPENEHIRGYGFYLAGTKFAEEIGYEGEFPEDVYIGIRKVSTGAPYREKMQMNYDRAKIVLDGLIERYS